MRGEIMSEIRLLDDNTIVNVKDDKFGHQVYAKILADVFHPDSKNSIGISVALFGKWGQGKSSIVEMLRDLLDKRVKIVTFNAWKSRGDSIRRQMLLTIMKGIESPIYDKMEKFVAPGIPLEIRDFEIQESVKAQGKWWFLVKNEKLDKPTLIAAIASGLIFILLIIFSTIAVLSPNASDIIKIAVTLYGGIISFGVIVFRWFQNRREKILTSAEPVSDSQRLRYPDQFQKIFIQEMLNFQKRNPDKSVVIVVDDLDRCEPNTVVEALASIRQLGGKSDDAGEITRCRFLVPCDEKQVVLALETDGHQIDKEGEQYHDYKSEELLRKFFDVIIRMDSFIPEDMISYVDTAVTNLKLLDNDIYLIKELIGAVVPKDPRQVKKLINAYIVSKAKITSLQTSRDIPPTSKLIYFDNTHLLMIALRETVPDEYDKIIVDSDYYEKLIKMNPDKTENKNQAKAVRIVQALAPTSMQTVHWIMQKGLPRELIEVTNAVELMESLNDGRAVDFIDQLNKTDKPDNVISWLRNKKPTICITSQFRNVLQCLIEGADKNKKICEVLESYLTYPKLMECLEDFPRLLDLAIIFSETQSYAVNNLKASIVNIFIDETLDIQKLPENSSLKAVFYFVKKLTDNQKRNVEQKLKPILSVTDPLQTKESLLKFKKMLSEIPDDKCFGFSPILAQIIASMCSWEFYSTTKEPRLELQSYLVPLLLGENQNGAITIAGYLLSENGPLGVPVDLTLESKNGEYEAIDTLKKIFNYLPEDEIQKNFSELRNWISKQQYNQGKIIQQICNIFRPKLYSLKEEQIDELGDLLARSILNIAEQQWIFDYIGHMPEKDFELNKHNKLTTRIFMFIVDNNLKNSELIEAPVISFLAKVEAYHWQIDVKADEILADAIKNKITDEIKWKNWKDSLWPLSKSHANTKEALIEKIRKGELANLYIQFYVNTISQGEISQELAKALRTYLLELPDVALSDLSFNTLFSGSPENQQSHLRGAEMVIDFLVNDLSQSRASINDKHINFAVTYISLASKTIQQKLLQILETEYLQDDSDEKVITGIKYIRRIADSTDSIKRNLEQASNDKYEIWKDKTDLKDDICVILKYDVFEKIKLAKEKEKSKEKSKVDGKENSKIIILCETFSTNPPTPKTA